MNAIQKSEAVVAIEEASADVARWGAGRWDLVKRTVCPKGISDDEFMLFAEQCRASGFNPLLKEAFCVPRNTKVSKKGEPDRYVTQHVFQPSVDGMLARSARFPDFLRARCEAVYENDRCEISGEDVAHTFNPCRPRGALKGAWAKVERRGHPPTIQWLPVGSRSGQSQFWTADPGGMLAKCCLAAALRKAYPATYSGIHASEELPTDADQSRAGQVLQSLDMGLPDAERKAVQELLDKTPALPPPGPVVVFGQWRDRPVADLDNAELEAAIAYGTEQLNDPKHAKAKFRPALEKNLAVLSMERHARRDPEPSEMTPTELSEEEKRAAVEAEHQLAEPGSGG